jgi:hypothetical protein
MTDVPPVVPTSERGRALLSQGAFNAILREAGTHAGEQWIARFFPLRFDRSYASGLLGYAASQRRDPWAAKDPGKWPETYDQRKREWQGHDDPLVWTGRMRSEMYRWVSARAIASKGQLRVDITFGRINVGNERTGYRQLGWGTPAGALILRTLTTIPETERAFFAEQLTAYIGARLGAISAPAKSAARLPAPPPVLGEAGQRANAARVAAGDRARSSNGTIINRMRLRIAARASRNAVWRTDAGGSSPLGQAPRTPAEAKLAHRLQARASYYRNRSAILARRRVRRGTAGLLAALTHRLQRNAA